MSFRYVRREDVANEFRDLDFDKRVAVCDVGNGDHSILLNDKSECGNWFSAFDPWWYGEDQARKEMVSGNDGVELKNEAAVNVRIHLNHLLDSYVKYRELYMLGAAYPVGNNIEKRFLTVVECQSRK